MMCHDTNIDETYTLFEFEFIYTKHIVSLSFSHSKHIVFSEYLVTNAMKILNKKPEFEFCPVKYSESPTSFYSIPSLGM
jgi:hypothetical protein